jgi:undecaprenyl-diphosphatase
MPGRLAPPTDRTLGRTAVVLMAGLMLLCAAVAAVGWVLTHPLQDALRHENAVNRWFVARRTGALDDLADVGTFLGETLTGGVVLALLALGFSIARRTWWPIVFVAVVDAGMGLLYLAGTTLDPRDRPPVHILQPGLVPDASFPSGHSGTATAVAGVAAALLWAYTRAPGRWLALLLVLPAYTMLSRLYVGAHHVSDVLTAFVYGTLWVVLCARMILPARAVAGVSPGSRPVRRAGRASRAG